MNEFTLQMWHLSLTIVTGIAIGSYFTAKWLAFITRKKRHAKETALREIANHQWNNGTKNDAMAITRIALRGLKGE